MNTVILAVVLFFNGTSHVITQEISMYDAAFVGTDASTNMRACWRIAGEVMEGVDDAGISVLSVQCTVQPLKE